MSAVGMGVLYTQTSEGEVLRSPKYTSGKYRSHLLEEYYFPHHNVFYKLVESALRRTGSALIIDCHSFPSVPLPYELDQSTDRPDICIGTDDFHTPVELGRRLRSEFVGMGYRVDLNAPFSGSIVPTQFYQSNTKVKSAMIEVNRQLYMNEKTTEKNSDFPKVCRDIASALEVATPDLSES
jgi:N-formylglutamate amidohydrolase